MIYFLYWLRHWSAINLLALKYNYFNIKLLFHDVDKLFLCIIFGLNKISNIHRKYSSHHLKNKRRKNYKNMILDWESARYTKIDKPESALEYFNKIKSTLSDIDKKGLILALKYFNLWKEPVMLWLDDYRNPYENDFEWSRLSGFGCYYIMWAKNYSEFEEYLITHGLPDYISFDHDLGEDTLTGYDCAKYLVQYCEIVNKPLPKFYIHSANPVGRINIQTYLNNYEKLSGTS